MRRLWRKGRGPRVRTAVRRLARGWCRGLPTVPQQLRSFVARTLEDCGGLPRYERDDGRGTVLPLQEEDGKAGDRLQMMMDDAGAAAEGEAAGDDDEGKQEDERQLEPLNNDNNGKAS